MAQFSMKLCSLLHIYITFKINKQFCWPFDVYVCYTHRHTCTTQDSTRRLALIIMTTFIFIHITFFNFVIKHKHMVFVYKITNQKNKIKIKCYLSPLDTICSVYVEPVLYATLIMCDGGGGGCFRKPHGHIYTFIEMFVDSLYSSIFMILCPIQCSIKLVLYDIYSIQT